MRTFEIEFEAVIMQEAEPRKHTACVVRVVVTVFDGFAKLQTSLGTFNLGIRWKIFFF